MHDVPHSILPPAAELDLLVAPSLGGSWTCAYRTPDPRYRHANAWRPYVRLSREELLDVVVAVVECYLDDMEAQEAF